MVAEAVGLDSRDERVLYEVTEVYNRSEELKVG